MTCQVLLANSHGIAIASDTAVTVGSGIVHTGAQKIYSVSDRHRIAVVHAGNVAFHGIPYGVLIPEWVASLNEHPLRTVAAYRESFLDWLRDRAMQAVPTELQELDALALLSRLMDKVWSDAKQALKNVDVETAEEQFLEWITNRRENWENSEDLELFEGELGHETFLQLRQIEGPWSIGERLDFWFDDVPRNQEIDAELLLLLELMFRRSCFLSDCSTLAFAGFGQDELFAGIAEVDVRSLVSGDLQVRRADALDVPRYSPQAVCVRQGQASAINSFLMGYSSDLVDEVAFGLDTAAQSPAHDSGAGSESTHRTAPVSDVLREKLDSVAQEHRMSKFWHCVSGLPTPALAETARRLVNIQSLELLLHGEVATVSKECQVAVITKADGFSMIADAA